MVPVLFALTLFLSAALLFLVQPMVGKLLLPPLGGTPAVWASCLVFFQGVLLLGYLYAHLTTTHLGVRRQAGWHLLLLVVPPVSFILGWLLAGSPVPMLTALVPVEAEYPVLPLLGILLVAAGPAFFVLATTGPLLQRWVSTGSRDPYVLYAASNAGSLLGLLAYPFVVEPTLGLPEQQCLWAAGVALYFVVASVCAILTWRSSPVDPPSHSEVMSDRQDARLSLRRVLRWLALSALTSALLSAGTLHLTTDIAPMPLLWVVPLSLYLISFVIVFWRWPDRLHRSVGRIAPMLLLFLVVVLTTRATEPLVIVVALPLVTFFALCLICHGELARDRPRPEHLTAFYLYLSLGGVLGSLFCALASPLVFHRLGLVEFPLALVLAALVRPGQPLERPRIREVGLVVLFGVGAAALVLGVPLALGPPSPVDAPNYTLDRVTRMGLMFGVPAVGAYALVARPVRFALALAVLLLAGSLDPGPSGKVLHTERNFFGTLRVTLSPDGRFRRLVHGTTLHGQQRLDDLDSPMPVMYYHPTGPAGRVLLGLPPERRRRVGLVGLGCGSMASYAKPGDEWVFWEIDPAVIRLANDTRYFTFLSRCPGQLRIVPGDARRQMERELDGSFDVLVLDAFSSDAIPVHLLTREALALYMRKLSPGGLILFHVSNRYLDLPPLLARLAAEHDPPLRAYVDHNASSEKQSEDGKMESTWVLVGQTEAEQLAKKEPANWRPLPTTPGPLWTDAFSNLLGVWKVREK